MNKGDSLMGLLVACRLGQSLWKEGRFQKPVEAGPRGEPWPVALEKLDMRAPNFCCRYIEAHGGCTHQST